MSDSEETPLAEEEIPENLDAEPNGDDSNEAVNLEQLEEETEEAAEENIVPESVEENEAVIAGGVEDNEEENPGSIEESEIGINDNAEVEEEAPVPESHQELEDTEYAAATDNKENGIPTEADDQEETDLNDAEATLNEVTAGQTPAEQSPQKDDIAAESENILASDVLKGETNQDVESVKSSESIKRSPTPQASGKSSPSPKKSFIPGLSPVLSVHSSPLGRNRLSFGSDQPSAPPGTPADSTPLEPLTLDFAGSCLDTETEWYTSEETVRAAQRKLEEDDEAPSYWILPPPGSRLATRKKRPSFFIRQKMLMIEERDQTLKRGLAVQQNEKRHSESSASKHKHFREVWSRYNQLMDEWWTKKEDGLERKLQRVRQIERCQQKRAKEVSQKMFLNGLKKFQAEKEMLAKEREERQQQEILNEWLAHVSRQ